MRLIVSAIALAAAVAVATPLAWIAATYRPQAMPGFDGGAVDSAARIDIEILRQQIEDLQSRLGTVERELSQLKAAPAADAVAMPGAGGDGPLPSLDGNRIAGNYAQVVVIGGRRRINEGISVSSPRFLIATFGMPREVLSDDCEPMTNPALKALLVTQDVGPIRVSMLRPAVESLGRVFERVRTADPDLYARISTAGALCVRRIRGSQNAVSTHAFGLAVDLNIDGVLDTLGDGRTQLGLVILSDFFQEEGWFWGAAFGREDSMHFEVSQEMIAKWRASGVV